MSVFGWAAEPGCAPSGGWHALAQLTVCLPGLSTRGHDMQLKLGWLAGKDLKRLHRQVSSRKLQKFWKSFRTTRSTTAQLAQAFLDTGIPTSAQVEPPAWQEYAVRACTAPLCLLDPACLDGDRHQEQATVAMSCG